ncbi:class I SAM-dependent methyltransferase [Phycicoccus sp. HDW14]|uniref:class I SAM-dependent methyltransferase n=1 Tax=Phycicoccus sp. HDW14 TaxID=2714941 RepID=UPI00140BBBBD|nr:class I SAM-dependent methyltransferase [Phycicoccus sp. HDW14]QIM20987.1 class I SAM-dependent methyltransferase [Phycicoccus sp. HDW14]
MTSFPEYYRENVTWVGSLDVRLAAIADLVVGRRPGRTLDLGCGQGVLLGALASRLPEGSHLVGMDVVPPPPGVRWRGVTADITGRLPFADDAFDVVVAGEVLEHVPHPDLLLAEIRRILQPGGRLVLSTPNIVGWANRVLVPLGIQPLFTETSSEVHLGRRWRVLGQGNQVQGHLKVFSHRALAEILARTGFTVLTTRGMPGEFPSPVDRVDRLCARFPSIASDLLVVAEPAVRVPDPAPARRKDTRPPSGGTRTARPTEDHG